MGEASQGSLPGKPEAFSGPLKTLTIDMGGPQRSVFQAQGTACAKVPEPWDRIKACHKCLSGSPITLYLGFVCRPPQFSV